MSYNTLGTAKALVGVDLTQELLNEAQGYIHNYTRYRWSTTAVIDTFSSKDFKAFGQRNLIPARGAYYDESVTLAPYMNISIFLKMPVITLTYVKVDDVEQEDGTDYELRADIGELKLISFAFIGSESLTGIDDIKVSYTYGYDATHDAWPNVIGAEARIALLLKNNPLLLTGISLQGDRVDYGDAIARLLKPIPKPFGVRALTR